MNFLYGLFVLVSTLAMLVSAAPVETTRATVNAGEIAIANAELKPVSKSLTSSKRSVPARYRSWAERRLRKCTDAKRKSPKPKKKKSKKVNVDEADDKPEEKAGVDDDSCALFRVNEQPGVAATDGDGDHKGRKNEKTKKKAKHTTKKKSGKKGDSDDASDQTGSDDDPGTDNASEDENGTDRDED